ncbi:MAG: MBL fold metallo-hydrolase [Gemmatimonadales bacterium]|nr:MBL fold metallo-hydrolase [Gemmatimonadales bacterium]
MLLPLRLSALVGLALGIGGPAIEAPSPPPLEIHFLDVGQAEAILIKVGARAVLVDAGRADDIIQVLREYQIDSLEAAIASHNHDDHIGGMNAVIADFPIRRYLANGRPAENGAARDVEEWLLTRGVPRPPPPWEPIVLDDVRISVFPSPLENASENNSSLGVLVERGSFRALLTGDSEIPLLNAWLAAGRIPRVTVLKAAHHGARDAVTPGWIDRTRPEVVVISVGAGNPYGHPAPMALRYYQTGGRSVYRTDLAGTVTVTVDDRGRYNVTTTGPTPR